MRWLLIVVLLSASAVRAAQPTPLAAELEASWNRGQLKWILWGVGVIASGAMLTIPGATLVTTASDRDTQRMGGVFLGFAAGAVITAIAMFVYRGQDFWAAQAYWESAR